MNATRSHSDERIVVIGGGLIGLAVAWQLARRGRSVSVLERDTAGRGASWVAAGMLAPVSEYGFENEDFLAFGRRSGEAYPAFLDELRTDSGLDVAIDTRGTLVVGLRRDEVEQIRRVYNFREDKGLPVQWLSGTEARELEPLLSPKVTAAMWIPDDHQIDNRALVAAVKEAFIRVGGELHERTEVLSLRVRDGRCAGAVTAEGEHTAETTVLAAGCWSSSIRGIPPEIAPNVRPVKGQIVSLKTDPAYPFAHVIRTPDVYLLPKGTSRVLIGATEEEMGFDVTPTAGPVMRLIERAWEAVPSVYDLPIESIDAGLRPGTRDHEPLIGESGMPGLIYATGHYRHGILLAPVTAYAVSKLVVSGKAPAWLEPFAPSRIHNRERRAGQP